MHNMMFVHTRHTRDDGSVEEDDDCNWNNGAQK